MGFLRRLLDKHLPTVPHEPKPEDLVALTTFTHRLPADQLALLLESVGIRAAVFGDATTATAHISYSFDGIRVMVRYDDLKRAQEVLEDFEEDLRSR